MNAQPRMLLFKSFASTEGRSSWCKILADTAIVFVAINFVTIRSKYYMNSRILMFPL